jgi:hypothetical protein
LLLYVVASHSAVSAALVQEKLDAQVKKQAPVYFVSEVLSLSKKNYIELEKVLYAVLMASRKLQHYFQAYHIIIPSSQPLKDIMRNREATGRIGKWAAELNEFTIDYVHRSSIQPTWSLQRWGLDLLGPLPPAQGNLRYVVVVVEYFSKWIEAKPLATITSVTVQKFFLQNIVYRFGVPKAITVDNGTQFHAESFKEFCDKIGTKIHFASVRHPESNGLVERANNIIMTGIMKLIFNQPRGKWPDELIKVVWSHNTTISRSTGFTPFKLLFGDEAITPEEAKAGSIRTTASAEDETDYHVVKDTIEGTRLQAVENINKYQAETIKWRDRKVRLKNIKPGHLVLRRVANPDTVGKLQLMWEGPFLVVSSLRPGSYRLKDMDGNDIPRSWNADELR